MSLLTIKKIEEYVAQEKVFILSGVFESCRKLRKSKEEKSKKKETQRKKKEKRKKENPQLLSNSQKTKQNKQIAEVTITNKVGSDVEVKSFSEGDHIRLVSYQKEKMATFDTFVMKAKGQNIQLKVKIKEPQKAKILVICQGGARFSFSFSFFFFLFLFLFLFLSYFSYVIFFF